MRRPTIQLWVSIALAAWAALGASPGPATAQPAPGDAPALRDFGFVKVLVPAGWHVKEEDTPGTRAVFVTKEPIVGGGSFKTGLSINGIRDIPAKTKVAPSVFAKNVIANLVRSKESRDVAEQKSGALAGALGFFRSATPGGDTVVLFSMALGNDTTGSMFVVTFESPEGEWADAWKVGESIVRSLDADSSF